MRTRLVITSGSAHDIKCLCAALERLEGGRDILRSPDFECGDLEAERAGRCLSLAHLQHGAGIADIGHDRQPAETGDNLAQEFESLAGKIGRLDRQAGDVAARSRQARDQAAANRVRRRREHDRDDRCRLLCRENGWGCLRDDDIDLEPDELGRDLGVALAASLRPAILDRDGATLDPAEFAQPLHKSGDPYGSRAEGVAAPRNPMVGSFAGCCARAASGHAAAAPPSSVMNSRRLMRPA